VRRGAVSSAPNNRAIRAASAEIPSAPGAIPVFGHSLQFQRKALRFLETLPAYGDLVRIRLGTRGALVVCDPELTAQMLRQDRVFDKRGGFIPPQREFAGENLVNYCYDEHRGPRRIMQPAFQNSRMSDYAKIMNRTVDDVLGSWRDGQVVDLQAEMYRIAINIVYSALMGVTVPIQTMRQLVVNLRYKNRGLLARVFMPAWHAWLTKIPSPANRRYRRAVRQSTAMADEIFATLRPDACPDTLAAMLFESRATSSARPHNGGHLSDAAIRRNLGIFVLAGSDTTANSLAWSLHLLGQNPDSLDRARAELDGVLDGNMATFDDLARLSYLENVFAETLRLYPPSWIANRQTTSDARLGRYFIPAGTTIFWSPYLLHRRADLFPDPERFVPDRWAGQPLTGRASAGSFVPFSLGPRKCIGDSFARIEALLVLAAVLSRWDLQPVNPASVEAHAGSLLTPRNIAMRITARTRSPKSGDR